MNTPELGSVSLAILIGYALGSIPFPYIAVRLKTGQDLRHVHTGNVGVMNSMSVLGRWLGSTVLLAELAKGFAATWVGLAIASDPGAWLALLAAVLGANWCIWLGLHGGRGNTTFAGGLLLLAPSILAGLAIGVVVGRTVLGSAFLAARLNMALMPVMFGLFGWWRYEDPAATTLLTVLGAAFALVFRIKHSRESDDHIALMRAGRFPGSNHGE